jgi:hypothetical protein
MPQHCQQSDNVEEWKKQEIMVHLPTVCPAMQIVQPALELSQLPIQ